MFGPGFKLTLTHQPQACSISHLTNTFSISTDVLMRNLSLKKTLTNKCTFKHFTLVKPFTLVHTCVLQNWDKLMHVCVHMRTRGLEMLVLRKLRFGCRKWLHTSNKITSTRRYLFLLNEDVLLCSETWPYRWCHSPPSPYSTTPRHYCMQPWKQTQTAPRRSLWPPEWWYHWCASSSPDQPGNSTSLNLDPFKSNNNISVVGLASPGSTQSGCFARETKRWSSRACPDGQSEGAMWSCRCPRYGMNWRLKCACLRWAGTSFPVALSNLPCLNRLWMLSRRREGEAKQEKEEERGKMNTPTEKERRTLTLHPVKEVVKQCHWQNVFTNKTFRIRCRRAEVHRATWKTAKTNNCWSAFNISASFIYHLVHSPPVPCAACTLCGKPPGWSECTEPQWKAQRGWSLCCRYLCYQQRPVT